MAIFLPGTADGQARAVQICIHTDDFMKVEELKKG
jgi:hypothetical protein